MIANRELERRVETVLEWGGRIDVTGVAVLVESGLVTLRGYVCSHAEREAAERLALQVSGTRAVANELAVRPAARTAPPTDPESTQADEAALMWLSELLRHRVTTRPSAGDPAPGVIKRERRKST